MAPFRGTFDHTLDAKSRLTVPARYRATLASGVVLAIPSDMRPCVGLWRVEDYDSHTTAALARYPALSGERSELQRFLFGNSQETELDAAGRVMIPGFLGEHASLSKEVFVVGAGDRLELWNRDAWREHQPTLRSNVVESTERVDRAA